jgi:hypothetical protein
MAVVERLNVGNKVMLDEATATQAMLRPNEYGNNCLMYLFYTLFSLFASRYENHLLVHMGHVQLVRHKTSSEAGMLACWHGRILGSISI